MRLKVILPDEVLLDRDGVDKVSAEAENGSFTLLPRHIDFVTSLVQGILSYRARGTESFVAVDRGILVKVGDTVSVSTRHGVRSDELGTLREIIERRFSRIDRDERRALSAFGKLEAGFMRRLMELK